MSTRSMNLAALFVLICLTCWSSCAYGDNAITKAMRDSLLFHAGFDGSTDATTTSGDGKIYTANNVADAIARRQLQLGNRRPDVTIVKGAGKYGDALRFSAKVPQVLVFLGENIDGRDDKSGVIADWSGTFSFWMRLDPQLDLQPGFCDPIQLTQHAWNNGAMFVDFDDSPARDFRLGLFPDLTAWNPDNTPWEQFPVEKRPMVTVKKPPFSRQHWTHVAFTFSGLNAKSNEQGTSTLYLNGKPAGTLQRPMPFSCELSQAIIMVGVDYIGDMDDLAIFRRALTAAEIAALHAATQTVAAP